MSIPLYHTFLCPSILGRWQHRKINETEELKQKLTEVIENLIVHENVDTFLFGSKSEFNDLCRYTANGKIKPKKPMKLFTESTMCNFKTIK